MHETPTKDNKLRKSYTSSLKQTMSEPTERPGTDNKLRRGLGTRSQKTDLHLLANNLANNESNE